MHPERFSVATLALLQQTAGSLRWTFERLSRQKATMVEDLNYVKGLYEGMTVQNAITFGTLPYPPPSDSEEKTPRGMAIEFRYASYICPSASLYLTSLLFRNVTFAYPGDPQSRNVLQDVNIVFPPSSLVVIVGANGSGKSSLVKLLSNLYRPKSGEILVDSHPISAYHISDLRKATALLTQDHSIFPLTIGENIGLGDPENAWDLKRIEQAATLGGSSDYVAKLPKKWNEILYPVDTNYSSQYPIPPGPMKDVMAKVEKQSDLSGMFFFCSKPLSSTETKILILNA